MTALEGPLAGLPFVAIYIVAALTIVTVCAISHRHPLTGIALCVAIVSGILLEGLPV